jgi:hypothetical protein
VNVKVQQAQTSLALSDARTGLQVTIGSGSSQKSDFSFGGFGAGTGGALGLGAYENTPEGKVVASAFLDAYNQVVKDVRNRPELSRKTDLVNPASAANVPTSITPVSVSAANPPALITQEGQVLRAKINGIKVYSSASKKSRPVCSLKKGEEVVATGQEQNTFVKICGEKGEGWVDRVLMAK